MAQEVLWAGGTESGGEALARTVGETWEFFFFDLRYST